MDSIVVTVTEPGGTVVELVDSPTEVIVVAGPPGAPGPAGVPGMYWGHGAPSGDHGWVIGSLYMNVDNGDVYSVEE